MRENKLIMQRYYLSLFIQERNEREGLDTSEKRLEALGRRMSKARADEKRRLAIEAEIAEPEGWLIR